MRHFASVRTACLLAALTPWGAGMAQGTGFSPGPMAAPGTGEAFREGPADLALPLQPGQTAADIQGIGADGATLRLSQFKGKVILLDVSAMWCIYCKMDAPAVQYLFQTYGPKGLAVVTCLAEDTNGAVVTQSGLRQWVSQYHLTQNVMNDTSGTSGGVAERAYVGVTGGFPTLVVIDKNFKVQYLQGGLDLAALTAKIKALLAE